jgi:RluA family pseudouridine synthase
VTAAPRPNLAILYEDEYLLVVDKPSGLLSVPTPGAQGRCVPEVLANLGRPALPVHRLDRDVSGALLLARDVATRDALQDLFRARALSKVYWALALGGPTKDEGAMRFPISEADGTARVSSTGKPSLTHYRVLARGARANEVEIELETGRYNQIRLHFAHSGWPLVGERKYARSSDDPFKAPRVALHAWKLAFEHPHTRRPVAVVAPLPARLAELRERVLTEEPPPKRRRRRAKAAAEPAPPGAPGALPPPRRKRRPPGRSDAAVAKRAQKQAPGDPRRSSKRSGRR